MSTVWSTKKIHLCPVQTRWCNVYSIQNTTYCLKRKRSMTIRYCSIYGGSLAFFVTPIRMELLRIGVIGTANIWTLINLNFLSTQSAESMEHRVAITLLRSARSSLCKRVLTRYVI